VTELFENENFNTQWSAFLRKSALTGAADFSQVLTTIGEFLSPVFSSIKGNKLFDQAWAAPGPWRIGQR